MSRSEWDSAIDAMRDARETSRFRDRADAGARLAERLRAHRGRDVLVLGIPRGGVPVAAVVAETLGAELDVLVARKLGAPSSPELAVGAVTADGGRFINTEVVRDLDVDSAYVERETRAQMAEAARRETRFRGGAPAPRIAGREVILVDDGLATGATMIAAARAVRQRKPAKLVLAVPVGSTEAVARLAREADEVVCLSTPEPFWAVGLFYRDFQQVEDEDVERILGRARASSDTAPTVATSAATTPSAQ